MATTPSGPVGYDADIRPLFRDRDIRAMRFAFDLSAYDDVRNHAADILERLRAGDMPCDDPWPQDRIDVFARWIETGMPR